MRLSFEYSNGTQPFEFSADGLQATPLELLVVGKGSPHSKQRALDAYIRSLDYLFRGVMNYASNDIIRVSVEKGWFGKLEKLRDSITWTSYIDKLFMVSYGISINAITENMYVADAIVVDKGVKGSDGVSPLWIKELLNPKSKAGKAELDHVINAVSLVTQYVYDYDLVYGFRGNKGLTVVDKRKKPISIEDIESDEEYILVRLVSLLLSKGLHQGMFFINAQGFSERILRAFVETAKLFFGDTFIFLYNCPEKHSFERVRVGLPNFLVPA